MSPNVPRGAAMLLDFIAKLETNRQGQAAYETIIGYRNEKPGALPRPITEMTLEELLAEQKRWVRNLKAPSGAAGRYQIIRPTLLSLIAELGVPLSARFTPDLQDRFGFALLKRRGWTQFAANGLPLRQFGDRLAREWASWPVLGAAAGRASPGPAWRKLLCRRRHQRLADQGGHCRGHAGRSAGRAEPPGPAGARSRSGAHATRSCPGAAARHRRLGGLLGSRRRRPGGRRLHHPAPVLRKPKMTALFSSVALQWWLRRLWDWGGMLAGWLSGLLALYGMMPAEMQATLLAILGGRWGDVSLAAAGGFIVWGLTQWRSYIATVKPQIVTEDGRQAELRELPRGTANAVQEFARTAMLGRGDTLIGKLLKLKLGQGR